MKIFFLVFHVKPLPYLEDSDDIAGAYVSCWVDAADLNKASKLASNEIESAKWDILEREEANEVTEAEYAQGSEELEFYKQALTDKCVIVFYTYPYED